jgi:hypothetical protein
MLRPPRIFREVQLDLRAQRANRGIRWRAERLARGDEEHGLHLLIGRHDRQRIARPDTIEERDVRRASATQER